MSAERSTDRVQLQETGNRVDRKKPAVFICCRAACELTTPPRSGRVREGDSPARVQTCFAESRVTLYTSYNKLKTKCIVFT